MKKTFFVAATALFLTAVAASAQTIAAQFTFEISQPATAGPFNAEVNNLAGTGSATALGFHAGTSTYSSPAGAGGSAHAFSSNTWAVNDYYQFSLSSTTGYAGPGLTVSFAVTGSGTGPANFTFQYSTDNATYTTISAYTVTAAFANQTFDISNIAALNNSANPVYFRLTDTSTVSVGGGTVGTGGTSRVDNFTLSVVPEPATYAYVIAGLGGLALVTRRRVA